MSIQNQMDYLFKKAHPALDEDFRVISETFDVPSGCKLRKQMSSQSRQNYEISLSRKNVKKCPLCNSVEGLIFEDSLIFTPDPVPFTYGHMLIRPLKNSSNHNKATIPRIKKIHKDELACRTEITKQDITAILKFVEEEKSYMILQSESGSGASIPEHIHAHCFLKKRFDFPLLRFIKPQESLCLSNVKILPELTFGVAVSGCSEYIATSFERLDELCSFPVNRIFFWDQSIKQLTGVFIPRSAEFPQSIGRLGGSRVWKFGCFEVLGLFDVKTEYLFDSLTVEQLIQALKETTIQNPKDKERLLFGLKEVMCI